jgi:hypothetical protein
MNTGFLVNNLGSNQLAYYLIRNINQYLDRENPTDIIIFYEQLTRPCFIPNCAVMYTQEAWSYDGVVIATNLSTAEKLLRFPSPKKKYFYVWDLEWLRHSGKFSDYKKLYRNPELKLIARSVQHAHIIEQCWNTSVAAIIENVNIEKLVQLCQN